MTMRLRDRLAGVVADGGDLVFGRVCAGCGEYPGLLCDSCTDELVGPPALRELIGDGGVPVAGAASYAGVVGGIVVEHKERGRLGLSRPLGDALAVAVTAATEAGCTGCAGRQLALVPVPSRRSTVRGRGHDPVLRTARRAASVLRRAGQEATVIPALRHARKVADQAGLGRVARDANVRGSMVVRRSADRLLAPRCPVLVDDVMTSGATLRECVRAFETAGLTPCAAAVIAIAT
ncbi:ComF family protein [Phytoactinopolyspora alkaliphila]|uniref:ComF family protein n=1 Tax=Phytoactinopolyspora alkaliphila TaxID=1783498 RepID=A0A6N9YQQ7_9ACTN|nr:ComF family protein [Phytoactinopolyspora alkaliphila]NED97304.1 ComF family protein [Phytoactinopolyspora alkaliphila]